MPILNKLITTALPIIPKSIVGQVAKRYIAGTLLNDGVRVVQELNNHGMTATMDLLGEFVQDLKEAEKVREGILEIIQAISENNLLSGVSIKPTQLGLQIDKNLAYRNIKSIVEAGNKTGLFVRIDMEDARTTDDTLEIYRRIRADGLTNTGVVIQAYLHRSEDDVKELLKDGTNFRICKGIYNESPSIAFKGRQEIRDNFIKLLRLMLENGNQTGIATHDDYLINGATKLIHDLGISKEKYEFQMLLGVREKRRNEIVREGYRLRVYVPFGEQWYAYSTRRLKENPNMAWYITKAIFIRN
jgi:proline dehydrogenase